MNTFEENTDFLSRPYAERQLIVVMNDEQMRAEQEFKAKQETESKWMRGSVKFLRLFFHSSVELAEATLKIYKGMLKLREQGVKTLSISQADAGRVKFPPGHPRFGVLYIAHPAAMDVYFPFAQFHRLTFEHKFSEAVILLMSLGATSIEVQHVAGWSKEFSSKMDISIPAANVGVRAGAGLSRDSGSEVLFTAKFNGATTCSLPDNLVWYHHEPTWQQIAEGRMKYGLKNFSLSVRYEDDLGVNMSLKTAATKAKLEIGGNFEDHRATVWKIVGEFD